MQAKNLAILVVLLGTLSVSAGEGGRTLIKPGKDALDFYIGDELVTRYLTGAERARPIFWPVLAPGQTPLTRAWPLEKTAKDASTDHPHQKSAWFCHGDVSAEGIERGLRLPGVDGFDFWSEAPGHGRIVCTRIDPPVAGKDRASVRTQNEWRTSAGVKILDETRTLHIHDLGAARLLVLDIDLHATAAPLTFGDTKEGALGVRVNDAIRSGKFGKGKIQNADGKIGETACWGQVSAWCDYSGAVDGKEVGLTLLADPRNPHPSCWHVRDYGLMAANPFGRTRSKFPAMAGKTDLVRVPRGEHLRLRYGMLLHSGDAEAGRVAEHYRFFAKTGENP